METILDLSFDSEPFIAKIAFFLSDLNVLLDHVKNWRDERNGRGSNS